MSTRSYWRDQAKPIICAVIARVGTDDGRALQKALFDTYPWGERRLHPYRIWRDEIRRQLQGRQHRKPAAPPAEAPGQLSLWKGSNER